MLLIIDNYDSFTYNLVQYFQCLNQDVLVKKHDEITLREIKNYHPEYLVISPGPKGPENAGISVEAIQHFYQKIPLLGVCLGHQCLSYAFGGKIIKAPETIHGKASSIIHHKRGLFTKLPMPLSVARYHSLAIEVETLPPCFAIDAWADTTVMAISHREYPVYGIQFHPESILTEYGMELLSNFLSKQ